MDQQDGQGLGLRGRVVVVTGGGHGIGAEYCRQLGRQGANVVVLDLDGDAVQQVCVELEDHGAGAMGAVVDVTSLEQLSKVRDEAVQRWGAVHGVVNNAGIMAVVPMNRGGFEEISESEWDHMMAVNVKGPWFVARAFVPAMSGYGKIVNIGSSTALKGVAGRLHYVCSKAAIQGMTRTLAVELAPRGVRVNCLAPGSTLSEEDPDEAVLAMRSSAATRRAISRTQVPEDLAGGVLFLLSPMSDFMTGQTMVIDGGEVMP